MAAGSCIDRVRDTMLAFADRSGLRRSDTAPRRYLWTDAHAVCNFLSLYRANGEHAFLELALSLVDQVHSVLGRHREDDPRQGWISGLDEAEGRVHPTAGGLRIGKALAERGRSEPVDERLEWERDGQYFHYLTRWVHALCRVAAVTDREVYGRWAAELARAAFAGFVTAGPQGRRLRWKMSIDLSYPLVASSGHHDPLDGYLSVCEVGQVSGLPLDDEKSALAAMLAGQRWETGDPLGIGGLLFDANRLIEMTVAGGLDGAALADRLLLAADNSLAAYSREHARQRPAGNRLGFREFGLSIGLHAVERMDAFVKRQTLPADLGRLLDGLGRYLPLAGEIESFWLDDANRMASSWREHRDINEVMLATSLLPEEFLAAG